MTVTRNVTPPSLMKSSQSDHDHGHVRLGFQGVPTTIELLLQIHRSPDGATCNGASEHQCLYTLSAKQNPKITKFIPL
jgi:hypothetical protein